MINIAFSPLISRGLKFSAKIKVAPRCLDTGQKEDAKTWTTKISGNLTCMLDVDGFSIKIR